MSEAMWIANIALLFVIGIPLVFLVVTGLKMFGVIRDD